MKPQLVFSIRCSVFGKNGAGMISVKQRDIYVVYLDFLNKRRIPLTSDL